MFVGHRIQASRHPGTWRRDRHAFRSLRAATRKQAAPSAWPAR